MATDSQNVHSIPVQAPTLRPSPPVALCDRHMQICPVAALEAALAREHTLLRKNEALLAEQELLRSESDHRLLNGLQMVASLLSLQSRAALTPDVATQLSAAANRVATIERVHRRLHFHDGAKTVALRKYLKEFCQEFSTISAFVSAPTLDTHMEGDEIEVPATRAIPLGFIANELVTNAVKYGKGRIVVSLDDLPDGRHELAVSNGGPPLPQDFDPSRFRGLGMKIIQSFVKKIGGEFRFKCGPENQGARFSVIFS